MKMISQWKYDVSVEERIERQTLLDTSSLTVLIDNRIYFNPHFTAIVFIL